MGSCGRQVLPWEECSKLIGTNSNARTHQNRPVVGISSVVVGSFDESREEHIVLL